MKIVGDYILSCLDEGKESIVAMDCCSLGDAQILARRLNLKEWCLAGMADNELRTLYHKKDEEVLINLWGEG